MSANDQYRAAVARRFGGPEVLRFEEMAVRPLAVGQVRVAVRYSGLNPVNARIRAGAFGGSVPYQPGTEFLGEISEVGSGSSSWRVGDVVQGFGTPASNADLVTTTADRIVAVPAGADLATAAAVGAVGMTAVTALDALQLAPGSRLLVHAGAGGVGTVLVQLAVAAGLIVVATASERNQDYLRSLGATPVVYGEGLAERLVAASPEGYGGVVEMSGTAEAGDSAVAVVRSGGAAITLVPETMQSHGLRLVQVQSSPERLARLLRAVADGSLVMPVEEIAFTDIVEAHRRLDSHRARGKMVLSHADNLFLTTLKEK